MALIQCRECGRQISELAATCPSCGAPAAAPARDGWNTRVLMAAALVGLVIVVAIIAQPGGTPLAPAKGTITADLLPKRAQCRSNLRQLQKIGVGLTRSAHSTSADYNEAVWESLTHDDKVRQAALIFCADMPDSGRYSVYIRGLHNGRILASLIDGNYFDD